MGQVDRQTDGRPTVTQTLIRTLYPGSINNHYYFPFKRPFIHASASEPAGPPPPHRGQNIWD